VIHSGIKVWDLASGTCLTKHDGTRQHLIGIQPAIPPSRTSAGLLASRDEVEATGDVKTPARIDEARCVNAGRRAQWLTAVRFFLICFAGSCLRCLARSARV
jgi:hypothetical protein